jgi:hypothetical protein
MTDSFIGQRFPRGGSTYVSVRCNVADRVGTFRGFARQLVLQARPCVSWLATLVTLVVGVGQIGQAIERPSG